MQTDPFTNVPGEIATGSLTLGSQPAALGFVSMSSQGAGTGPVTVGAVNDCKVPVTVDDAAFTATTARRFLRLRAVTP